MVERSTKVATQAAPPGPGGLFRGPSGHAALMMVPLTFRPPSGSRFPHEHLSQQSTRTEGGLLIRISYHSPWRESARAKEVKALTQTKLGRHKAADCCIDRVSLKQAACIQL